MGLVQFTSVKSDRPLYVNSSTVVSLEPVGEASSPCSIVTTGTAPEGPYVIEVKETLDEVANRLNLQEFEERQGY